MKLYDKPPTLPGMRVIANHVMMRLRREADNEELTKQLQWYAESLDPCSQAFARRLEATRLRWLQRYDEALEILSIPTPPTRVRARACELCEGDRFFRLAMTSQAMILHGSPADQSDFTEPLGFAKESQKIFHNSRWVSGRLRYVMDASEASAMQPLGQCLADSGEIKEAVDVFSDAYQLLGNDAHVRALGKGFRPHWWGKSSNCCPSLPTYSTKLVIQGIAFGNLTLAYCSTEDTDQIQKALEMIPKIKEDYPRSVDDLNSYRAAWLEGRLLVVKHYQKGQKGRDRFKIRNKVKVRLKYAYVGFLNHPNASPADALAVLADICSLPWNAGKTADIVRDELGVIDVTIRPALERRVAQLPEDTRQHFERIRNAVDTSDSVRIPEHLDRFRLALAELSWPPMAAWKPIYSAL